MRIHIITQRVIAKGVNHCAYGFANFNSMAQHTASNSHHKRSDSQKPSKTSM